ncbi:GNAT family N-acetyltransferase [Achromobacter denitrificans]
MQYRVRPMLASDVGGILAVQTLAYPDFLLESAGFFLNRLALAPSHCWIAQAVSPAGDSLLGYLVSYPWDAGLPPALDVALAALPAGADHWFLHDCAVAPPAQGLGVGQALLRAAAASALEGGLCRASLVSLASAAGYWQRNGYAPVAQGLGVGQALLRAAAASALEGGLCRASLVSLASAAGYWQRNGYAPVAVAGAGLAEKLAGYGPQAVYMSRALPF